MEELSEDNELLLDPTEEDAFNKMLEDEIGNYLGESGQMLTILRSNETEKRNQLEEVEYKYAIGNIPQSSYEVAKRRLSEELSNTITHIGEIENQLSNT